MMLIKVLPIFILHAQAATQSNLGAPTNFCNFYHESNRLLATIIDIPAVMETVNLAEFFKELETLLELSTQSTI